jgi:hypothetical protein
MRIFFKESGIDVLKVYGNLKMLRSKFFHPPNSIRNWKKETLSKNHSTNELLDKNKNR